MFSDALQALQQPGAIGVLPTDTVYGVVARAADPQAVARLYELKQPDKKPGTIIAAGIEQLVALGIKRRYLTAVEQFWPGAVSVIIPSSDPTLAYIRQGKLDIAIRLPKHAELTALLKQTGPLVTSCANQPGQPPANTVAEARQYFGKAVDFYIDGGDLSGRQPSTIIRVVDDAVEVIRQGAVKISED